MINPGQCTATSTLPSQPSASRCQHWPSSPSSIVVLASLKLLEPLMAPNNGCCGTGALGQHESALDDGRYDENRRDARSRYDGARTDEHSRAGSVRTTEGRRSSSLRCVLSSCGYRPPGIGLCPVRRAGSGLRVSPSRSAQLRRLPQRTLTSSPAISHCL